MRRLLRLLLPAVALAALLGAGLRPLGPLPPLGQLLDPVGGVWGLAPAARLPREWTRTLPGLGAPVTVEIDDRGVPHIFAAAEEDAHRVLGWLVARDRLFQLELQTRAPEGTLTELVGVRALPADRASRAAGLPWGAARAWGSLDTASATGRALIAYAEGVNAWLDGMSRAELPIEYRLLGRRPRRWEPRHSLLLFARMGQTLASEDPATVRLAVAARVGRAAAEVLVPINSPLQQPIVPGPHGLREAFVPVPPPGAPDSAALRHLALLPPGVARRGAGDVVLGSNNWAVAPGRTRDGYAILSGDPHLQLTLPSIWYEAHLQVPGRLDVAGVTLPGAPGVVIGFNRETAWSFTNTGADVLDVYEEVVDDPRDPARYRLDGAWQDLTRVVETYRDTRGRILVIDTLRYTHRGPLRSVQGTWVSTRWTVLEPSLEVGLFLRAGAAGSVDEWLEVMEAYGAPTQNGLVADRRGAIAIRSSGWYPIRPGGGRGDRVFDGTTRGSDWLGMLPIERQPSAVRPTQGFLVSANQQPVDPLDDPVYLGANWPSPMRAIHINRLLRGDSAVTVERMRRMHTDPGSARADALVPLFLQAADAAAASGDADLARARQLLAEWDRRYTPDNRQAILFELAVRDLYRRLFDELLPADTGTAARLPGFSGTMAILSLARDPDNPWWDQRGTPNVVETRDDIVAASLRAGYQLALRRHGAPGGSGWRWGSVWPTDIHHLLRLPALSSLGVEVQGGPETIAPAGQRGSHGASWRMVVELGPEVRALGTYPGGQSGNPASPWYADRIPQWARGELDTLRFPIGPGRLPEEQVRSRLTLRPE